MSMSMTRQLILNAIQEQMEQGAASVNAEQYGAAQQAFLECAKLCQQLEIERQLDQQPLPARQLTINIQP